MLASASIAQEKSVTNRPCQQHRRTEVSAAVYPALIRSKISNLFFCSCHTMLTLLVLESKLAAAKSLKYLLRKVFPKTFEPVLL